MGIWRKLYDAVLKASGHRRAVWFLGGLSFAESSFFPIPPDVMLAPMVLARPHRAWFLATVTTLTSVAGGIAGYFIGAYMLGMAQEAMEAAHLWEKYLTVRDWFGDYGFWAVLIAGFSPIPYKVFTIAAGAGHMLFIPFVVASLIGRGARFFLVAGLVKVAGPAMEERLLGYIDIIGWILVALIAVGVIVYQF
ncbi:MAG: hypothetical protein CMN28_11100 [Salinisphaeraceae bacterium]|nr:hypothetical protein [Salinisphaeraceae bacterium]